MIKKTVNKVVEFIEQNAYFHAPYLDFIGVYTLGEDWDRFKKGEKVILLKAYELGNDYHIINRVEGAVRLGYIVEGKRKPILIPEGLKFYLGGVKW